jgi:hypothetical protein
MTAFETITTVATQRNYDLPASFRGVISVSYPYASIALGNEPPYLTRLSRRDPRFWSSDDFYDVEEFADASDPAQIWISASPADDEYIRVHYSALYPITAADLPSGLFALALPTEHEPIIMAFVTWRAHQERLATEAQNPDTTIRMLQQMKLAVQATEFSYRQSLRRAIAAQAAGGPTGPWEADDYDRIY